MEAGGGNDMENALTSALVQYPDAEDYYVMCDGDIDPFTIESWKVFCARNATNSEGMRISYHFIAVGSGADFENMREMAEIGGGNSSIIQE